MTDFDEERRDVAEYLMHLSRVSRCRSVRSSSTSSRSG